MSTAARGHEHPSRNPVCGVRHASNPQAYCQILKLAHPSGGFTKPQTFCKYVRLQKYSLRRVRSVLSLPALNSWDTAVYFTLPEQPRDLKTQILPLRVLSPSLLAYFSAPSTSAVVSCPAFDHGRGEACHWNHNNRILQIKRSSLGVRTGSYHTHRRSTLHLYVGGQAQMVACGSLWVVYFRCRYDPNPRRSQTTTCV